MNWSFDMKVRLVEIDIYERRNGRGFMKRVKDRWDSEFPESQEFVAQNLNDNAGGFKEQQEIVNLVLVRGRTKNVTSGVEQVLEGEDVLDRVMDKAVRKETNVNNGGFRGQR